MVTALVMLCYKTLELYFIFLFSKKNVVIKGNVYAITQFFTLLSTGKQEKKIEHNKKVRPLAFVYSKKCLRNRKSTFCGLIRHEFKTNSFKIIDIVLKDKLILD